MSLAQDPPEVHSEFQASLGDSARFYLKQVSKHGRPLAIRCILAHHSLRVCVCPALTLSTHEGGSFTEPGTKLVTSKSERSSCLFSWCPMVLAYRHTHGMTSSLCGFWRVEFKPSCLHCKCSCPLSRSPRPLYVIFKERRLQQ